MISEMWTEISRDSSEQKMADATEIKKKRQLGWNIPCHKNVSHTAELREVLPLNVIKYVSRQ